MTVKQLKDFLNDFPDDYDVCFYNQEMSGIAFVNYAMISTLWKRVTLLEELDDD